MAGNEAEWDEGGAVLSRRERRWGGERLSFAENSLSLLMGLRFTLRYCVLGK
jgi:hypothetical protein